MLTSIPGRDVPSVGVPHVDKVVHFLLYAVLGWLVARARPRAPSGGIGTRPLLLGLAAIALFAGVDEWHQQWVPGRAPDLLDWCADVVGAAFALLLAAAPALRPRPLT